MRANLDHLTSFKQSNKSVDEWFNVVQDQVNLSKYPLETAKILYNIIFWIFLHDEESVSRTTSDGNVDLDKFLANKVQQFAKRMESSKAITFHVKQVAGDPQAVQINLFRHQCTELQAGENKKTSSVKPRQCWYKLYTSWELLHQTL